MFVTEKLALHKLFRPFEMLEQVLLDLRKHCILDVFICYTHDLGDSSNYMMLIKNLENLVCLKGEVILIFVQQHIH